MGGEGARAAPGSRRWGLASIPASMKRLCPGCGSADLHLSRDKSLLDRMLRLAGLPARRCTACGWRGYLAPPAPLPRAATSAGPSDAAPAIRAATLPRLRWSLPRIIFSALFFGAATGLAAWILSGEP